jgi:hypothetical protein
MGNGSSDHQGDIHVHRGGFFHFCHGFIWTTGPYMEHRDLSTSQIYVVDSIIDIYCTNTDPIHNIETVSTRPIYEHFDWSMVHTFYHDHKQILITFRNKLLSVRSAALTL